MSLISKARFKESGQSTRNLSAGAETPPVVESTFRGRHLFVWPPVSAESHSCPIVKPSCGPVPSSANLSLLIVTCVALTLTSDTRRF